MIRPIRPMLAKSADTLPIGADWTYEVKWDGYRTLAAKDGQRVRLWSRNLKDATAQYPSIARSIAEVHTDTALLDGEIVALDENGRPSFQALHHQSAHILVYYAFDVLHVNGRDTIKVPLTERRSQLAGIVASTRVLSSDPLPGTPGQIEQAVRGLQLEGIVAKRQHSIYEPGRRSSAWVKVKFNRRQEFVIGGYKPNATNIESLVVGYYEAGKLHFAGRVRAGLTPLVRADIFRRLAPDRIDRCPFADLPNTRQSHWGEGVTAEDMVNLRWVKPRLVIEVSFVEWTRDGALRHSEFVALRTDKRASDVGRG
ncbi:MAG: non-homologous end-joining DNA ligase [Vicinamibacterales bacterium]